MKAFEIPGTEFSDRIPHWSLATEDWRSENDDPGLRLRNDLAEWLKEILTNEKLFKTHVYENQNLSQAGLRQHRGRICHSIATGEYPAMMFTALGREANIQNEVAPAISLIDQQTGKLFDVLMAWHGPLDAQPGVPESFKQASKEAKEGNVVDLDAETNESFYR